MNNKVANLLNNSAKTLLTTTAITAVGLLSATGNANAQSIDPNAIPTGGTEIFGDVTITQEGTHTDILQREEVGLLEWTSFDHGENATTNFDQPNSSSWTFNKVKGNVDDARGTIIEGKITANGNIGILDDNGVLITEAGSLDAAGVLLSTGELSSTREELNDGKVKIASSESDGAVVNKGRITVSEAGVAAFVSPTIKNSGKINAKMGTVVMAAGETVTLDMYGDGLVEVAVDGELAKGLIENTGKIKANGGNVKITAKLAKDVVENVINLDGVIDVSAVNVKNGKVVLSGDTKVASKKATSKKTTSKKSAPKAIVSTETLERTEMLEVARIEAPAKAGSVDVRGSNINVTGIINANGTEDIAAGSIVLFADNKLTVDGQLSAQGLAGTGFIETSGDFVDFERRASILANREWLIDPINILIDSAMEGLLETGLAAGNVTLVATNDIDLTTVIDWSTGSTFQLDAGNDINFNSGGGVESRDAAGHFVANAGDDIRLNAGNEGIIMFGGDVTLTAGDEFTLTDNRIVTLGGDILIDNAGSFEALASSIQNSMGGSIELNQNKDTDGQGVLNPTIQNAIDATFNFSRGRTTVNVGAGTWNENVKADARNLQLLGNNAGISAKDGVRREETIISAMNPGDRAIEVNENNVLIDGFTIDSNNTPATTGIFVTDVIHTTILNNEIVNSGRFGIHLDKAFSTRIERNNIDKVGNTGILANNNSEYVNIIENSISRTNDDAIRVLDARGVKVKNNMIMGQGSDGVEVRRSRDVVITGNMIDPLLGTIDDVSDGDGIDVSDISNGLLIDNNTITNSQNGILARNVVGTNKISNNMLFEIDENGIEINSFDNAMITSNMIDGAGQDGIQTNASDNAMISENTIMDVKNGIYLFDGENHNVNNNNVSRTGTFGVASDGTTGSTIEKNNLSFIGNTGVFGQDSTALTINMNTIDRVNDDGVRVIDSKDLDITNNMITGQGSDGVDVRRSSDVVITGNNIDPLIGTMDDVSDGDGIDVSDISNGLLIDNNTITNTQNGILARNIVDTNKITNNTISDVDDDGIRILNSEMLHLRNNTIERAAGDAINLEAIDSANVHENTVTTANVGLNVIGPDNGVINVFDNSFTGTDIGAQFESGQIDLTGTDNTFNTGRTALRFAPVLTEGGFAPLSLVGDTIGAQTFDVQTDNYVELVNGAFFNPGTPTDLNAADSTYLNTPLGTFTPAVDGLTDPIVSYLETQFVHFNDDATLGRFFPVVEPEPIIELTPVTQTPPVVAITPVTNALPPIEQQDIFNTINGVDDGLSGLSLTILPLDGSGSFTSANALNNLAPNAGGNNTSPESLNDIETAAGDEGVSSSEDLNNIETASGGEKTTCWNDAISTAENGETTILSYGGSAEDLLNSETNCETSSGRSGTL